MPIRLVRRYTRQNLRCTRNSGICLATSSVSSKKQWQPTMSSFFKKKKPTLGTTFELWNNILRPAIRHVLYRLNKRYHQLCKRPGTQSIETWLDNWTMTYTEAKEYNTAEVFGDWPVRDFLNAIWTKAPNFSKAYTLMSKMKGEAEDLFQVIERFRQHLRMWQLHNHKSGDSSHLAFAANTPTFQGQPARSMKPPTCICGEKH